MYTPHPGARSFERWCSVECGVKLSRAVQAKKALREFNQKNKRKSDYANEAQTAFNFYIRERDRNKPCVSCGIMLDQKYGGAYDAGHYRSVGSAIHTRYVFTQVWKQCKECNHHRSGNHVEYRKELIRRIGEEAVLAIEHDDRPRNYSREDLERIKRLCNKRGRHYQKLNASGRRRVYIGKGE